MAAVARYGLAPRWFGFSAWFRCGGWFFFFVVVHPHCVYSVAQFALLSTLFAHSGLKGCNKKISLYGPRQVP